MIQAMSSPKLRVLTSNTFDPWFNLATEDWIFRDMDPKTHILFLWRNKDTVVIGRNQNPWAECYISKMEEDGIKLARRQSGGGAVFHDLGNTNFTFMNSRESYSKETNSSIIIKALEKFSVKAYTSGRNDILVDERKISGSAYKENNDRAFHHGTLLINADLTRLGNYLNPNKKKLEAKGVSSVRARVANLVEFNTQITHENLCDAIIKEFFKYYQSECPIEHLDHEYLKSIPELNEYYLKLSDWNWRFGKTPEFSHHLEERLSWGLMDLHLEVKNGKIEDCQLFSDALYPDLINKIKENLKGVHYHQDQVLKKFANECQELMEFGEWLARKVAE